jgi:hypothetical protein
MKKYIAFITFVSIIPSVAFASWWNPASWSIFSFLFSPTPQVQTIILATSSNQTIVTSSTVSIINTNTATTSTPTPIVSATPAKQYKKSVAKPIQPAVVSIPSVPIQTQQQPAQITTPAPVQQQPECGSGFISTPSGCVYPPPVISSASNGVISGQGFTNADEVYIVSATGLKIDLPFTIANDNTINIIYNSNTYIPNGQYNLYVASVQGGTSLPYQTFENASQPVQQQTNTQPTVSVACQQAQQAFQTANQNATQYENELSSLSSVPMGAEISSGRSQTIMEMLNNAQASVQIALEQEQVACQ